MRDTAVSVTDRDRVAATRGSLIQSLFPRFDEAVSPEFYRLSGRLRAITNALFLIANLVLGPQLDALGFDHDVQLRVLIAFLTIHAIDLSLGLLLWKRRMSTRAMRRITFASIVLETTAAVTAAWVYGSVNSYFMAVELVFILMYRLAFDFRTGLVAFVLIVVGQWAIVAAEVGGVLPAQPIGAHEIDKVYLVPMRQIGSMVYLTIVFGLTFVVANWAVGRMRHKDIAIRLLRESLYATERGKVGRHTGRTLRDTYLVGALLGSGGMGEVYAGTHTRTRRKVAIKMLHPHLVADPTVLTRFRREAEVTGKLGSEHIVNVIDVDEDDGQPFLVLEYMAGESLAARIAAKGPLALEQIADLVDQIAAGLDVAHQAGVIHRDLKPENLMLCPKPGGGVTVKILDFGVSKIRGNASALTHEIAIVGTPDFMSPEQAVGNAESVDASSDVFALGGVVYTALTGRRPFQAGSVPALLRQIVDEEPPAIDDLRADVPGAVADVIAVAMAKRPAERYASATDLSRDLRAAIAGGLAADVHARAQGLTRGRPAGKRFKRESINPTGNTQPA